MLIKTRRLNFTVFFILFVFLLVVLTGCSQKIKTKEQNSSNKVSEADEAAQTSNKGTPLYGGDSGVEVLPWHDPSKPPCSISELIKHRSDITLTPEQEKWLKEELWKWEWRKGWKSWSGEPLSWEGSWYLVPSKLPPDPPHTPPPLPWPDSPENHDPSFDETIVETEFDLNKILPFVLLEGDFWYWKGNHWELGPEW